VITLSRWRITKDIIDKGKSNGVQNFKGCLDASKMPHKFRLFDGDGELYFEGIIDDDSSFDPIDDYGINFGCTSLKLWNPQKQKWEEL
jgi:hypothetical protein